MKEQAKKGKFKVAWLPGEFEGYVFDGPADMWNGHPIPMFEIEQMWAIVSALYDTVNPEIVQTEDGEKVLYPVGAQAWEWTKVRQRK
jgi:hypothetical protein